MNQLSRQEIDVVVIGGGQSGLAVGYFLRRTGCSFVILDAEAEPGGAWLHGWESLRLFSPAEASSLPGWPMPHSAANVATRDYPTRQEVIDYLMAYESRYQLPVRRPERVRAVSREKEGYLVETDQTIWHTQAVVCATGTWSHSFIPPYPGLADYKGRQLHSANYTSPTAFAGQRVLVVGGGNSGAQILAEISRVADATWVTPTAPTFLPDDVDGRVLFNRASEQYHALQTGNSPTPAASPSLGDVVMVPPVKEARDRGVLHAVRPFTRLTKEGVEWPDGRTESVDSIIWCTGFRPATDYLQPLGIVDEQGRVATKGTRATQWPGLWLVGYGTWTGFASATIIGVGRSARDTAAEVGVYCQQQMPVNARSR